MLKAPCHSYPFMTRYCKLLYGIVNAYARGVVKVLYAGAVEVRLVVPSRYARGAVEVQYARGAVEVYAHGAVEVHSWSGRGTLTVWSWCSRGTLVERSRYAHGTVLVQSRYARGALPVRLVNFSTGDTVCVWICSECVCVCHS